MTAINVSGTNGTVTVQVDSAPHHPLDHLQLWYSVVGFDGLRSQGLYSWMRCVYQPRVPPGRPSFRGICEVKENSLAIRWRQADCDGQEIARTAFYSLSLVAEEHLTGKCDGLRTRWCREKKPM